MASDAQPTPPRDGLGDKRGGTATRRRAREAAILDATRELFDRHGVRNVQLDDIARAVRINRAIIYRHFNGKLELFALTLQSYLAELHQALHEADDPETAADERLRRLTTAFADFGMRYPAFVDCALTLMQTPGAELFEEVSESAVRRLGQAMLRCLAVLVDVLEGGRRTGVFQVDDVHLLANALYAQGLGALQLARVGLLVKEAAPDVPTVDKVEPEQLTRYLISASLAMARAAKPAAGPDEPDRQDDSP